VGHAPFHGHAEIRHLLEHIGVVGLLVDRLRQVLADLVLVDVERGHEIDVPDVVAAQVDVHQARHELVVRGVLVVVATLDQAAGAVANAHDRDPDLAVGVSRRAAVAGSVAGGLGHG
jgi:hypothetical protein